MRTMTRLVVVSAVVPLALVAATGTGVAGSTPVVTGGTHLTVDSSVFDPSTSGSVDMKTLAYNAHGTTGDGATGWWNYQETEPGSSVHASGDVTCLSVHGNHAWIGSTVTNADDPSYVGLDAWWQVQDNGAGAGAAPDMTTFVGFGAAGRAQAYCDTTPSPHFPFDVQGGQVTVH